MAKAPERTPQPLARLLRGNQRMQVKPLGARSSIADLYHAMLRASWQALYGLFWLAFIGFNLFFALLYWLDHGGIDWGSRPIAGGLFWRCFVFSVDTMGTVGYGNMVPVSLFANIVATIEIALGIIFVALVTGMAFARFSRPTARILFSKVAVVTHFEGVPMLMLRCANERHNLIFEASAVISLVTDEITESGPMRRFHDMNLVRSKNPVFALTWTIMHPIDDDSPLKPWLQDHCASPGSDVIVVVSGTDDRTGHTMYGRWSYRPDDLRWDKRFVDILGQEDGVRTIDYRKFHEVEEAVPAAATA
jgi:inward rectifier potassium channel